MFMVFIYKIKKKIKNKEKDEVEEKQSQPLHKFLPLFSPISPVSQNPNPNLSLSLSSFLCDISQFTDADDTSMMWDEWDDTIFSDTDQQQQQQQSDQDSHLNFDFFSDLSKPKDYYKILEVDYDANDDAIRSNYIRLALKWHPDKHKDQDSATSRFQEINEAYQVLSDPVKRLEYDKKGMLYVYDYNITEYLNRYKGLILTCSGLGMRTSIW